MSNMLRTIRRWSEGNGGYLTQNSRRFETVEIKDPESGKKNVLTRLTDFGRKLFKMEKNTKIRRKIQKRMNKKSGRGR